MARTAPPEPPTWERFDPASLKFLRALKRNNRREWFEEHRPEYLALIRDPMRAFVEEMDVRFARLAPEIGGDPKRDVFRIHRDVRFSKDKSPYKTHAACWFRHLDAGRDSVHGGAGFYVHLEPKASIVAAGIWMPEKSGLAKIRQNLLDRHEEFKAILSEKRFRRRFGQLGDYAMLKRMPRGIDPDHPAGELLRYKSFTVSHPLTDEEITHKRLPNRLETDISTVLPMLRWLNSALGFAPQKRRF